MRDFFIFIIILINFALFVGKLVVGLLTNSVALLSDAVNSFSDIINTVVVLWATKISRKAPDEDHPAGHDRAQPLAGFFIAIMTGVLAIEIIKESVIKIWEPPQIDNEMSAIIILIITIVSKGTLSLFEKYYAKKNNNHALLAMSTESQGDMLISLGAIIGIVLASNFNIYWADPMAGLGIGLYVFYTAYEIAKDNVNYLMGASADKKELNKIKKILHSIPEINSFSDLKAQYLGTKLQVTVNCIIKGQFTLNEWHNLEDKITNKIRGLENVSSVFVHMDHV